MSHKKYTPAQRRTLRRKHALLAKLAIAIAKHDPFVDIDDNKAECFFCEAEEVLGTIDDHVGSCLWRNIKRLELEPLDETPPSPRIAGRPKLLPARPDARDLDEEKDYVG